MKQLIIGSVPPGSFSPGVELSHLALEASASGGFQLSALASRGYLPPCHPPISLSLWVWENIRVVDLEESHNSPSI